MTIYGFTMKNKCIVCKKEIDNRAKRCSSCWYKYNTGKNNHIYKGGDESRECFCIDCDKKLGRLAFYSKTKRCKSCENKRRFANKIMDNTKPIRRYYCICCKQEISRVTFIRGTKQCRTCAGRNNSKKGRESYRFGKKAPHSKYIKYKNICMHSSWEVAYAKYLDQNNIKWQYEPKAFDLGNTTYRPDFYLSEKDVYIEIKGFWRDDALRKFKLFQELYSNIRIRILTKKSLEKLEIL
jgi:hypothetical protein